MDEIDKIAEEIFNVIKEKILEGDDDDADND